MSGIRYANMCERLLANSVLVHGECWEWVGAVKHASNAYYGQLSIRVKGKVKTVLAHRVAYTAFTGNEIPDGHEIDHECHNTLCINPAHVRCVDRGTNLKNRRGYK